MYRSWWKQLGFLVVVAMTFVILVPVTKAASAPNIVTYQGRVLNANGVPVSDSSLSISFALYTAVTGGTCVWSNSSESCATTTARTVTLTTGLFTENLGDTGNSYAEIGDSIFGDNEALYLEVIIAGETLTPRRQITAAPYALNADTLDGTDSAAFLTCSTGDCLDFTHFEDTLDLDAALTLNQGTSTWTQNFTGTTTTGRTYNTNNLTTGKGVNLKSTSTSRTSGDLMGVDHTATYTTTSTVSGSLIDLTQQLTNATAGTTLTASGPLLNLARTSIVNNATATVNLGGGVLEVRDNSTATSGTLSNTAYVVYFSQGYSGAASSVLRLDNAGSGDALFVNQSGNGRALFINSDASTITRSIEIDAENTNGDVIFSAVDVLTTGSGMVIQRADGTTDFDGSATDGLIYIDQANDNATSDGEALRVRNLGGGSSTAVYLTQNTVDSPSANSVSNQAMVIDVNESSSSDAVLIIRSDADGTPDTEFRIDNDGDYQFDGTGTSPASDVAEVYESSETLEPGDLVVLDTTISATIKKSLSPYEPNLFGGVSTRPALRLAGGTVGYDVALTGRIPLKVSAENGSIAVGDPLTSSATSGHAMKATQAGMIVGFALEPFTAGTGTISVFINTGWYAGNILNTDGTATIVNDDLVLAGRFFPSDRGTAQTSRYIYYDGDSGPGGDFMRTNASGWATGSYDFAEMFPTDEALLAGEVVVFAQDGEKMRRAQKPYDTRLAGIVSTRPGFLAGQNLESNFPVALAGRVPTKVTIENGPIMVGDPLTSSSKPGFAMKATKPGPIVGFALEPFPTTSPLDKTVIVFVNVGWWGGGETETLPGTSNTASLVNSNSLSSLNLADNLYITGNDILGIGRIAGLGDRWSIEEDGTIKTDATVKTVITSYQNEKIETVAVTATEVVVTLAGTSTLEAGEAVVVFEDIDPSFNNITSTVAPLRVVVTPQGPVSLYVSEKNYNGFTVKQIGGSFNDITFDWLVTAYRKDYEPIIYLTAEPSSPSAEQESVPSVPTESVTEVATESATEPASIQSNDEMPPVVSEPIATELVAEPIPEIVSESVPEPVTQPVSEQIDPSFLASTEVQPNDQPAGVEGGAVAEPTAGGSDLIASSPQTESL